MSKLISISLENLQSYKGAVTFDVTASNILVFRAQSETGKSVIIKFFQAFCLEDNPKDWKSIIRVPLARGFVSFLYDDGKMVQFVLETSTKYIRVVNPDGTEILYEQYMIDEAVLLSFGLIVDFKNSIVLNIYSRKTPLFFIDTNLTLNGSVINKVLYNFELENLLEGMRDKRKLVITTIKDNSHKGNHIATMLMKHYPKDTQVVETLFENIKRVDERFKELQELYSRASILKEDISKLPKVPKIDSEHLVLRINRLKDLNSVQKLASSFGIDEDLLSTIRNPEPIAEAIGKLKDRRLVADTANQILTYSTTLERIVPLNPLEKKLKLAYIAKTVANLIANISELSTLIQLEQTAQKTQEEIKQQIGICPICNSRM